jgi:hypothetical protein
MPLVQVGFVSDLINYLVFHRFLIAEHLLWLSENVLHYLSVVGHY